MIKENSAALRSGARWACLMPRIEASALITADGDAAPSSPSLPFSSVSLTRSCSSSAMESYRGWRRAARKPASTPIQTVRTSPYATATPYCATLSSLTSE